MAVIWRTCVLCITLSVLTIEGARILAYFPTPAISHQLLFRPLVHTLAKRGHEVIVVTTDPAFPKGQAPANLTEIDVHDVTYEILQELLQNHTGDKTQIILQTLLIFKKFSKMLDEQLNTPQVKEILNKKDKKYFDVLILEACNRPLLGISHMFDAPVIQISSFGGIAVQYQIMGSPIHPFLYPTPGRQRLYNLTLLEKATELGKLAIFEYIMSTTLTEDYRVMRKNFGDDVPSFEELSKNIQMMFFNEHPVWADNHPIPPSILYIGGIHQTAEKELPKDLKEYLDSSKQGVIYVSFGTNVLPSILPPEKIRIMSKVLSELPYNVLWKWDTSELPGKSSNIKTETWFPQPDLLKHPNIKLFITQGGIQSTDETINAAVPVIGIPMLGDQWYNVEKYVHHKIGLQLDITTLTEEEFRESVKTVIEDKSYKNNVLRLRSIMREHPVQPLDNAVWWTEHVIKYGGKHLKCPAANMPWMEYYEVKLVLFVLTILLLILLILAILVKTLIYCVKKVFRRIFKFKNE